MVDAPLAHTILDNLDCTRRVFEDLQECLLEERDHLVRLKVDELQRVTADKEEFALRHAELERERARILRRGGYEGSTLTALAAEALEPRLAQRLAEAGAELQSLVDATRTMNELNRQLLHGSLAAVARRVAALTSDARAKTTPVTYGHLAGGGPSRLRLVSGGLRP